MKSLLSISILLTIVFNTLLTSAYADALSNFAVRKVMQANKLQQQDKLGKAITVLSEYKPSREYDKAYINRMLAGFYWQKEDPENTIRLLTLAVDAKQLPLDTQRETLTMLADILITQGEYRLSEQRYYQLLPLLEENKALELIWLRLAQSQYQQHKWASVEKSVEQQQHFQTLTKIKPRVLPLNMQLGAQLAQKKWQSAIATTISLRELAPENEMWWRQLIALYMKTDDHQNALITLQQADRAKFVLSDQQLTLMAQLYAYSGVPYQAAKTYQRLTKSDKDPKLIAQQAYYWQQAKEWARALQQWDRAANLNPQYYRQYALLAIQQRELEDALVAIDKMPEKDASLLVIKAQILSEMGKAEYALNTITLAHQLSPSNSTEKWLEYLTDQTAID